MAGRRPTPTELKLVRGNPGKRPINKNEPKPAKRIPSAPGHLSSEGQVAWGRLTVLLDRMGVLTEADGFALERLCDCYCSGQLIPDTALSFSSATAGARPLLN
ncbi:protein of unknown function [Pseudomonas sp. JV241A]|nr:protein of unknown function [Pseudomonas sp. JV241A]